MPITGTTIFSYNSMQIIKFAMRKCGILEPGATYDQNIYNNFQESLNLILKSWITKGVKIWTIQELAIPFVASTTQYVLGASGTGPQTPTQAYNLASATPTSLTYVDKPMKLLQAWLRNTQTTPPIDTPLQVISQHNYNEFGSKFSTGVPNSVWLNVLRDQSVVNLYLTPDTITTANYQLHLLTQRMLYDVTTTTDNVDVPAEWYYALGWALAQDQILDLGVDERRAALIIAGAKQFLTEAEDFDTEYNSVYFTPDARFQKR